MDIVNIDDIESLDDDFQFCLGDVEPMDENEESFVPLYPVVHYSINKSRTAFFFSVRRFVSVGRKKQIETIQRYKTVYNPDFIDMVASDIYIFLKNVFGNLPGYTITNLPPGNSKGNDFHLATEISRGVASKIGLPYLQVFAPYLRKNKNVGNTTNKQRLIMNKLTEIPKRIILIDDVATTKTSIEFAQNRLKSYDAMIIPVVWVYSEIKNE